MTLIGLLFVVVVVVVVVAAVVVDVKQDDLDSLLTEVEGVMKDETPPPRRRPPSPRSVPLPFMSSSSGAGATAATKYSQAVYGTPATTTTTAGAAEIGGGPSIQEITGYRMMGTDATVSGRLERFITSPTTATTTTAAAAIHSPQCEDKSCYSRRETGIASSAFLDAGAAEKLSRADKVYAYHNDDSNNNDNNNDNNNNSCKKSPAMYGMHDAKAIEELDVDALFDYVSGGVNEIHSAAPVATTATTAVRGYGRESVPKLRTPKTSDSVSTTATAASTIATATTAASTTGPASRLCASGGVLLLGGACCELGVTPSKLQGVVNERILCLRCNRQVLRMEEVQWAPEADYMFFREVYPNVRQLYTQTMRHAEMAAYCCMCSWRSVCDVEAIGKNHPDVRWVACTEE